MIADFIVGLSYQPSEVMVTIRDQLELTSKGTRIFNAIKPEIKEKEEFNQICRDMESENAVLGCYRNDRVYVYNISNEELAGILEVTSAHELLHAVYHRMGADEKAELSSELSKAYEENREALGKEIELYDDVDKEEELYVRLGTEIADLPEKLERHFAEVFSNQDKIAEFYQGYIGVFRGIEHRLAELLEKTKTVQAEISEKTTRYETDVANLNTEIAEFNNCAKTPNCFKSTAVFNRRRSELMAKKEAVNALYDEIDGLISDYNVLAREYNENLLHGQALNMAINSNIIQINQL
jgi:hypothetical protein